MLKWIFLILTVVAFITASFTSRESKKSRIRTLWYISFFLGLSLTIITFIFDWKKEKTDDFISSFQSLEEQAMSLYNSREALLEFMIIYDSIENRYDEVNKKILTDIRQSYNNITEYYDKALYNQQVYEHQLIHHRRQQAQKLDAEQVHWYFKSFQGNHYPIRIQTQYVAKRNLKYFVEDLIIIVENHSSLMVASYAVAAIEKLTGIEFKSKPPYEKVIRWWENEGKKNSKYYYSVKDYEEAFELYYNIRNEVELAKAITIMKRIVEDREGFGKLLATIAKYELWDNKNEAFQYYNRLWNECDGYTNDKLTHIAFLSKQDKSKAVNLLKHLEQVTNKNELDWDKKHNEYYLKAVSLKFLP